MPRRNRYHVELLHESNPHSLDRHGNPAFKYGIYDETKPGARPTFRTTVRALADELVTNLNTQKVAS